MTNLGLLHLLYNHIQFVETLYPEPAIAKGPQADCLDCLGPKRAYAFASALGLDSNPRPHQVKSPSRSAVNHVSGLFCNGSAKYAKGRCPDRVAQGVSPVFRASLVQTSALLRPFRSSLRFRSKGG
jgi:hypothetical protein